MAIVVDEYGNTAGLVTMEDMVEEIVERFAMNTSPVTMWSPTPKAVIVSGSFDVDHLRDLLDFKATEDTESTTVGDCYRMDVGPEAGETVARDGIRIEVLAANELRVDQVRISKRERR